VSETPWKGIVAGRPPATMGHESRPHRCIIAAAVLFVLVWSGRPTWSQEDGAPSTVTEPSDPVLERTEPTESDDGTEDVELQVSGPPTVTPEALAEKLDFEQDLNRDGKPDGWHRVSGTPGYPHYVPAEWDEHVFHHGGHSLRYDLKGGNVAFKTEPLPLDVGFVYVLSGWLKTADVEADGLGASRASIEVTWLDESQEAIASDRTREISGTTDWQQLSLVGRAQSGLENARYAFITCQVLGRDTSGQAWFDDLLFVKLPRVGLEPGSPAGIFFKGEIPTVSLRITGLSESSISATVSVEGLGVDFTFRRRIDAEVTGTGAFLEDVAVPVESFGCYRVRARLDYTVSELATQSSNRVAAEVLDEYLEVETRFVYLDGSADGDARATDIGCVVDPFAALLLTNGKAEGVEAVCRAVAALGVDYVKILPWNGQPTVSELQEEMSLAAELILMLPAAVEPVVVLGRPSLDVVAEAQATATAGADTLAAMGMGDVFKAPEKVWNVLVNDTVHRLAGHVSYYQLGQEADPGFANDQFEQSVAPAAAAITPLWPGSRLGVPVDIVTAPTELGIGAHKFISFDLGDLSAECIPLYLPHFRTPELRDWYLNKYFPPFSSEEETTPADTMRLLAAPETGGKEVWTHIGLVSARRYGWAEQVRDMAKRLVFCRLGKAAVVFAGSLIGDDTGLLDRKLTPTPAFAALHTLSAKIGGLDLVLARETESGSLLFLFSDGEKGVLVAWNDSGATTEMLPLTPETSVVDLWGNILARGRREEQTAVIIGWQPVIIDGISPGIFEIAESVVFGANKLDSTIEMQEVPFSFTSTIAQPLQGTLSFVVPDSWRVRPKHFELSLDPGEKFTGALRVTLPVNEPVGERDISVAIAFNLKGKVHRVRHPKKINIVSRAFDVQTDLVLGDRDITILSEVTNNAGVPLNMVSYVFYGKRERVGPVSLGLMAPGETRSVSHTIPAYRDVKEPDLYICLRPRNDKRFYNRRVTFREGTFYVLSD